MAAIQLSRGADEIVMHPHGDLGPVDPQFTVPRKGSNQPGDVMRFGSEVATSRLHLRELRCVSPRPRHFQAGGLRCDDVSGSESARNWPCVKTIRLRRFALVGENGERHIAFLAVPSGGRCCLR